MKIYAVGIGPGDCGHLTPYAKEVILKADVIVGYTKYIELTSSLTEGKKIISTGMTGEKSRCQSAFDQAEKDKTVAVISSGDAGIYGMASLLFEMSEKYPHIDIEVVPGITAAVAAASILGSPLSNDFAAVSLSDLNTPWAVIEKRLAAAADGDFVICLYNPESVNRKGYLKRACDIISRYKPPQTCCGYVRNALRGTCDSEICTLEELSRVKVDMFTAVIIGNADTKVINGRLVTVRGYIVGQV